MSWKNSRGETEIFVLIIIIFGAFLLAGGQLLFQNMDGTNMSPPASGRDGTEVTAPGGANKFIEVLSNGCDDATHVANVSVAFKGPDAGYAFYTLKEAAAPQQATVYNTPPLEDVAFSPPNALGFNTKPWQIQLYSGGTQDAGGKWSDGTLVDSKDMEATGCK